MDPQNAQFYSIFVAPDLILWKIQDLKDRAHSMTEDEILHAYREIQYIASTAVSTSDHVKSIRRSGGNLALGAPGMDEEKDEDEDIGVDSVEPQPEPKAKTKKKPKRKRKYVRPPDAERLKLMKERGPLENCPTPQAKAIRQIRFDKILSQKEFGHAIGVHPVSIAQYERGSMGITDYLVNKIVAAFPEYDRDSILNPPVVDEAQGGQE